MEILKIIGVRFKKAGKIYFFDPGDEIIEKGDFVIVDTIRGVECGEVVFSPRKWADVENTAGCLQMAQIHKIHRKATAEDLQQVEENKANELKAFDICKQKIADRGLPMKLIDVNYTFDVNKIIFYFTADGRVDFRELVRDLAYIFHTRIELRQVGVRDDAKRLGGVGCCGRPLCCANFLGDFAPVSIRMAKEQNLSLNPAKISGICGRLLCCLNFESEYYHDKYMENFKSFRPESGDRVMVSEGEGKIISVNAQNKTATVLLDNRRTVIANFDDILPLEIQADRNISEPATDTAVAEIAETVEAVEEIAKYEEIVLTKDFVTLASSDDVIAEVEDIVEDEFDEPDARTSRYNRKSNYNKKFRSRESDEDSPRSNNRKFNKPRKNKKGGDRK